MKGVKNLTGFTQLNAKASRLKTGNLTGFTLIELLVVILVVGVLATLAMVSLRIVKISGRDARRISDVAQIQRALEIYKNDNGIYPAAGAFVVGEPLVSLDGNVTYFNKIPSNPLPDDGSGCSVAEYTYTQTESGVSYGLQFCLGKTVGGIGPNNVEALPNNVINIADAPAAACGNGVIEGAEVCDYTTLDDCGASPGYYFLRVGAGDCATNGACKSDCTACAMDCNPN